MSLKLAQLKTKSQSIILFGLGINSLVGIVLFIFFISPHSEAGHRLFLGLSASRVTLGSVFLALVLVNIGAFLMTARPGLTWQKTIDEKLAGILTDHLHLVMALLYGILFISGTFLLLSIPPVIRPLSVLESINTRLGSFIGWIFFSSLLANSLLWIFKEEVLKSDPLIIKLNKALWLAGSFLMIFLLYWHFAALIGWINKTRYSYWNLLADQFIHGKLYLENPPYTHDLTLYNNRWYVPMPPLPAMLMIPLAYWVGGGNISTSLLSMAFCAMNGILMFLILEQLNILHWLNIPKGNIFVLVVIFLFATPQLWVGISGRAWFVSQILTVLFLALAIYAALCSWSAWLIGICIAIAMLARPNSLMTWPFVFAISLQLMKERQEQINLKQIFWWSAKTMLPIALAIAGLLLYNHLRFDNFLDFGYTTLNGDPDIVQNVQTYGTFSPHFIPINLQVMLFKLPFFPLTGQWPILPSATGMSIFLTTPPLIYLFRRYPKQWWILGAWGAVFCNIALLSLYSNTGAHQFGYRYILDFLIPLIILLAIGLQKKIPWHFIVLTLAGIMINLYGANWFMNG